MAFERTETNIGGYDSTDIDRYPKKGLKQLNVVYGGSCDYTYLKVYMGEETLSDYALDIDEVQKLIDVLQKSIERV